MAAISGKDGAVSFGGTIAEVTAWSLSITSNNPSYASSSTAGYKKRVAGTKDVTGSFEGKWDGSAPFAAGDEAALVLSLDATATYSCAAVIDSVSFEVDIDDGEIISWSADFGVRDTVSGAPSGF